MINLILERVVKGCCPICGESLTKEGNKSVKYNNDIIFVCDTHYIDEKLEVE